MWRKAGGDYRGAGAKVNAGSPRIACVRSGFLAPSSAARGLAACREPEVVQAREKGPQYTCSPWDSMTGCGS